MSRNGNDELWTGREGMSYFDSEFDFDDDYDDDWGNDWDFDDYDDDSAYYDYPEDF